jgi:5-formyltetrahydrofolate cyclo-ligase
MIRAVTTHDQMNEKAALRRALGAARQALPKAEAEAAAQAACAHLLGLPELGTARIVGLYRAIRGEIDPAAAERSLAARGAVIALPRVATPGPRGRLDFHGTAHGAPVPGALGVPEPRPDAPEIPAALIDVLVIPGLGFDARGARLGWGRGHFDATLALAPRALRVGFAFALQLVPRVPESPGDERMDVIVTERGAWPTGARPHAPWRIP